MASTSTPSDLVLYHYYMSPFAMKVVWYLALRGIAYKQCLVPPYPPRDALDAIGVKYRRIPVLAHGRDVYCDTRLIFAHLDKAFPDSSDHPSLVPSNPSDRAYATLLEKWIVEAGMFPVAAGCLPVDLPAFNDPKFKKDRESFSGTSWSPETRAKERVHALVAFRDAFVLVEEQILGDGREWVLGGNSPTRADIDTIWPFHWVTSIPNSLPKESFSEEQFPKTYAWIKRFKAAVKAAKGKAPKPVEISGEQAANDVLNGKLFSGALKVDQNDPQGFKEGQVVQSRPTDWGFRAKDSGKLVGTTTAELIIECEAPNGKSVLVHYPRVGFKTEALDAAKL